jgi:hypothetical protein
MIEIQGDGAQTGDADMFKQSETFRDNANWAHFAEAADDELRFRRYKRMEAAWLALAAEQDWLDGEYLFTR